MIRLRGIEKFYDNGKQRTYVLQNINLDFEEGEFVTIMGPSGAGKSTLLSLVGMLDGEYRGEFHFKDQPVHTLKPKQRAALNRQHIGFVFQQYHLIDNLTVYENIALPLSYRNVKKGEQDAIVADLLDRFQIVGKKDLFPNQLSGGQQQLVAIARAVAGNPTLILADEPTGNLHSQQGAEIMKWFKKLNEEQGVTIIQVTHSEENASYGRRIVQMVDGRAGRS